MLRIRKRRGVSRSFERNSNFPRVWERRRTQSITLIRSPKCQDYSSICFERRKEEMKIFDMFWKKKEKKKRWRVSCKCQDYFFKCNLEGAEKGMKKDSRDSQPCSRVFYLGRDTMQIVQRRANRYLRVLDAFPWQSSKWKMDCARTSKQANLFAPSFCFPFSPSHRESIEIRLRPRWQDSICHRMILIQ